MAKILHKSIGLYPFQKEIKNAEEPNLCVAAGRRMGKSHVGVYIAYNILKKHKGERCILIGRSHSSIVESCWETMLKIIPKDDIARKIGGRNQTHELYLNNGSYFTLKGQHNAENLLGVSPSPRVILLDEFDFHTVGNFDRIYGPMTLNRPDSKYIICSTPGYADGELKRFYDYGQSDEHPTWRSWQLDAWTHRADLRPQIEEARKTMSPLEFRRQYEASFENVENQVFHCFDIREHNRDLGNVGDNDKIMIAIDINVGVMAAVVVIERDGIVYIVDEFSGAYGIDELLENIKQRYSHHTPSSINLYPDPASNQRQSVAGKTAAGKNITDLTKMEEAGFNVKVKKGHPTQYDSAECVNRLLRNANGDVGMYISSRCQKTISSLSNTSWDVSKTTGKRSISKKHGKEHWSDALRYLVEYEYPVKPHYEHFTMPGGPW